MLRGLLATTLLIGAAWAFNTVVPAQRSSAAATRLQDPQMFDLYPPPGAPPAPNANGEWFKAAANLGSKKMDAGMLRATGMSSEKKRPAKKVAKKQGEAAEAPGGLAPILGGLVVILGIVLATQAGA